MGARQRWRVGRGVVGVSAAAYRVALVLTPSALSFNEKIKAFPVAASPARATGSVECAKGTHVFGGGVSANAGGQALVASFPFDGADGDKKPDDGWRVKVDNRGAATTARVAAVCGERLPTYRTRSFTAAPSDETTSSAICKAGHVTGGGVDFAPPQGHGLINDTFPGAPGEWAVFVDNYTSHALPAKAYATCAQGQFRTVGGPFSPVAPFGVQDVSAKCPGGKQATGGGVLNEANSGRTITRPASARASP